MNPSPTAVPSTGPTILVVDDDPDVVRLTGRMLQSAGLRVIAGGTAAAALTLARQHRPALMLLDVNLPDGSGVDVAHQIKTDPDLAGTFVVIASGARTSAADQAAGLAQGLADGYIVRPIGQAELVARVEAFLRLRDTQEALRAALRDKDALIIEVHHRVKNNLTVISSLLRLAAGRIDHAAAKSVLRDMEHRVQSLALLHELLYRSNDVTEVDLASYLQQLASHLFRSVGADPAAIHLQLDLVPVVVPTAQAITCGLFVNELLTNSFKHAFPDGRTGDVRIGLRPMDDEGEGPMIGLEVSDTGIGLPADFAQRETTSLGMQLVTDLARQLPGRLDIDPGPGAKFRITFTAPPPHASGELQV